MNKVLKKIKKCETNNLQSSVPNYFNFLPNLNLKKSSLLFIGLMNFVGNVEAAGIIIPAGEWTLELSGNVNAFYRKEVQNQNQFLSAAQITGAMMDQSSDSLPSGQLGLRGKTRQNDLDVAFTISQQPGATQSNNSNLSNTPIRQTFLTFGDKSWGSVKIGKDIGIYASDAILNDMMLLGAEGSTGVGEAPRIGTGYMYADWKGQIAYTPTNFNGFQATVGITQPSSNTGSSSPAYEGKASYSFAGNDLTGKVWISRAIEDADVGASGDLGLKGYYYSGGGLGTLTGGFETKTNPRDSDGGYVQATYVLPTKTRLGVAYGSTNLEDQDQERYNERWVIGLYHPITKHLNLVAEYSNIDAGQIPTPGPTCSIE